MQIDWVLAMRCCTMEGTGVLRNDDQRLSKLGELPTPAYRLASLRLRKSNKTLKLLNYFELFPVPSHTLSDYFMPYTPGPCSSTGRTAQITGDGGSSNSSLLFFHIVSGSTFCQMLLIVTKAWSPDACKCLWRSNTKKTSVFAGSICTKKTPINLWSTWVWARGGPGVWGGIVKVAILILIDPLKGIGWRCQVNIH